MKETFVKLALSGLAYFSDIRTMIHAVLFLIVVDWITGIYASFKSKEEFKSYRLKRTIEKFVFYSLAIIVASILEIEFIDFANIDRIVAGYIALTEVKSIFENITKITHVKIFDAIWNLIKNQYNQSRHGKH